MKYLHIASTLALVSGTLAQRTFTVYNGCPFTIWPAIFTAAGGNPPDYTTGWEAAEYTAVSFSVPDDWTAGRIWARRDCDFSTNPGPNSCLDGGCNGGLVCDPTTGTGVPPASLAEFTLGGTTGVDYYDVSLVDGYNLPISINNNVGCGIADCPVDLGPDCPAAIQGPYDSTGFPVGCKSACEANLDGDPSNSPNCCTGSYDTPATCPSSGVEYYSYFKSNCPNSYCYAYDESSGTAIWTCDASFGADYTVTFCPPPSFTNISASSTTTSLMASSTVIDTPSAGTNTTLASSARSICTARTLSTRTSISKSSRLTSSARAPSTTWLVYLLVAVVGDNAMGWG